MREKIKEMKVTKVITFILPLMAVLLTVFMLRGTDAQAVKNYEGQIAYGMGEPDKGQVHEDPVDDDFTFNVVKNAARNSNHTVRKGIDVSHWQGDINWTAVKNSGVEFVFVKVGGRSNSGYLYEDDLFRQNLAGANAAGLKTGVYFYSEAVNEAEAIEEADYICGRIYNYNITMPVVLDYEFCSGSNCRLKNSGQSMDSRTSVCTAFCQRVQQYGYTPCVYANKATLNGIINGAALANHFKIWVAQYYYLPGGGDGEYYHDYPWRDTNYGGTYDFWQFSSQGYISGISGYVDLDYWYDDGTICGQDYSAIFDAGYYAQHNPDVVQAMGNEPAALLQHFRIHGMSEGRQGCAEFNPISYRNEYADLRHKYGKDWRSYYNHYKTFGKAEGRHGTGCENKMLGCLTTYNGIDYSAVYDMHYYLAHNKDVANVYGDDDVALLRHFVNNGMKEGRQAVSTFNVISYKNLYPDLRGAYGNNLPAYYLHYINYGRREGRVAIGYEKNVQGRVTTYNGVNYSAVYNYDYYIAHNSDIKKAFGDNDTKALEHFVNYGMNEGRQAKAEFNVNAYKNTYSDLRNAYGNNKKAYYLHYINYGKKEGRTATQNLDKVVGATTVYNGVNYAAVYNYDYYVAHNRDVYRAFGTDDAATLAHFVNYGMNEGRQAKSDFNLNAYKNNYGDLRNAYGNNNKQYYLHYINYGKSEGRVAK
ncbi:MAG: hypothetical protein K6B67_00865 [Lachnospiraceae bacterium]|nr:hypothetical protein [Lachnospiraceae bacterium]